MTFGHEPGGQMQGQERADQPRRTVPPPVRLAVPPAVVRRSPEPADDLAERLADQVAERVADKGYDDIVADLSAIFDCGQADLSVVTPSGLLSTASIRRGPTEPYVRQLRERVAASATTLVTEPSEDELLAGPVRCFAGAPLLAADGTVIGVLSALCDEPRSARPEQVHALERLAGHAVWLLELRRRTRELQHDRVVLSTTGSVLELIVGDADLRHTLDTIARSVEAVSASGRCSILIREGSVLRDGAGPSLPAAYREAVDGALIGTDNGSCAVAAHSREPVIVPDIARDPRWTAYADLALSHGLRACWSIPIQAPDGSVVGTFAIYHDQPAAPGANDLAQLARWVNLAEVAISRALSIAALRAAASSDALTGLANRDEALRRLTQRLAAPGGARLAVLFVDLDRFKVVNDTLGHHVGDSFLRLVAERLRRCLGADDVIARFGGDEFVIITPVDDARADALAHRLLDELAAPLTALGNTVSLSASVGISSLTGSVSGSATSPTALGLVSDADLAMYDAKRRGQGGVTWFIPLMRQRAQDRLLVQTELETAIGNGELRCVYQPEVELRDGRLVGVEALLRWESPRRGTVPPLSFVALAEECGLITAIGEMVLRQACQQLARWRADDATWDAVTMWVNVSPHQLADRGFGSMVRSALRDSGLPPSALGLEITESVFMADDRVARGVLEQLRGIGVLVAIDDFGTGFSSMSRLKHLPVDVLKIDREFVRDVADDDIDAQIVASLLVLAGSLGLHVIAEGVETVGQRARLATLGCGWAQGFLWSRPCPPDELRDLVLEHGGNLDGQLASAEPTLLDVDAVNRRRVTR